MTMRRRRSYQDIVSTSLSEIILFFLFFFLILLGGQLTITAKKGGIAGGEPSPKQIVILQELLDKERKLSNKLRVDLSNSKQKADDDDALIVVLRGEIDGLLGRISDLEEAAKDAFPPALTLDDSDDYRFAPGRSELGPLFRQKLNIEAIPDLLEIIRNTEFNITVIEVVGHTDQVPVGKQSNLDRALINFLQRNGVGSLTAADNAGLGLARATAVAAFLKASRRIPEKYKIVPMSAGQLVLPNGDLARHESDPRPNRSRRRVEIRVRGDFVSR